MARNLHPNDLKCVISYSEREIAELRAEKELAVEYLRVSMALLDDPKDLGASLLALHTIAEAYGGLGPVASEDIGDRSTRPRPTPTFRRRRRTAA